MGAAIFQGTANEVHDIFRHMAVIAKTAFLSRRMLSMLGNFSFQIAMAAKAITVADF